MVSRCCYQAEDVSTEAERLKFKNIMRKNKLNIMQWVANNQKSGYDSKPLSILWPLLKRDNLQKKTRKRGLDALAPDVILPSKRRSAIPTKSNPFTTKSLQQKFDELNLKNRKKNSMIRKLKRKMLENNIDLSDSDYSDDDSDETSGSYTHVLAEDTAYLNRHKHLLTAKYDGSVKRCLVDLIKRSLVWQLEGNLNASQISFIFKDLVNNLGLFPGGEPYSKEFFRSHKEIVGYINEFVLAERLQEGEEFVLYLDGSPSAKGKNLLSFGFFDEHCESWNIGIDQFEHFRGSTTKKSVVEGDFILDRIKKICERRDKDFKEIASKFVAVISDNAPAAEATRKYIIKRLEEIAPLEHKRLSLGCAVHWVNKHVL